MPENGEETSRRFWPAPLPRPAGTAGGGGKGRRARAEGGRRARDVSIAARTVRDARLIGLGASRGAGGGGRERGERSAALEALRADLA